MRNYKWEKEIVVKGVDMTKFGISELSTKEMLSHKAPEALENSNVEAKDLEALFLGNALGGFKEGQISIVPHRGPRKYAAKRPYYLF